MGIQSFAECLRQIVAARGWSLDALAEITGYKSRTSVARVLQEQSSQKNRERFFERLEQSGVLSPQEESRLRAALDVSLIGLDRAQARGVFRDLILDSGKREDVSPNLERLLEMLGEAESARVLAVNCLFVPFFARLRDLLSTTGTCSVRHYFNLSENEAEAAQAMHCLSRMTFLTNYAAFACERDRRNASLMLGLNLLCATVEKDGVGTDVLVVLSGRFRAAMHTMPTDCGLFAFVERVLEQAMTDAVPVTQLCSTSSGPESFVNIMQFCEACERERNMYHVKSDLCVNTIPTQYVRACLGERELLRFFPGLGAEELRGMLDTLLYFQRLRYKNMYESRNPKHLILTMSGLRRFAQTGLIAEHFAAMRPFTVRERIAILEDLQSHAEQNRHFYLYLFKEGFEPKYEVNCWDGYGMTAFPIDLHGPMVNYCNTVVCHPSMVAAFRDYFMEDLRLNQTLTASERSAFLRGLIEGLRAQLT